MRHFKALVPLTHNLRAPITSNNWKYTSKKCLPNLLHSVKRNGSGGRAAGLYTLVKPEVTSVSHKFRIVLIIISACLIKQPTLSRMYVQTHISVKLVAVSVHSKACKDCRLKFTSLIFASLKDPPDSCDWPVKL